MHRDSVEQWADAPETNSLATLAELATTSSEGVEFGPRARIAKLEEQALWYQAAMDAIALGVCLFDADARLIISNRRYAEIYGLAPEQIRPGATLREIVELRVAGGTCATSVDDYLSFCKSNTLRKDPTTWTAELGNGRTISVHLWPMAGGGWVSTHEDVTGRKVSRAAAKELQSLQAVIDRLPDNVWVKDVNSRFVIANQVTASRMGFSWPAELIGRTDLELLSPEIANKFYADEQKIVRCGEPMIDMEECVFGSARDKTWISTTKVPLYNDRHEIYGVAGISRDITERRLADALREGQAQILEMVALSASLEDVLKHLVDLIESQFTRSIVSILLLDKDGVRLRHGAAPSLPEAYVKAFDGERIGPKMGSCGTAAYRREAVFVSDIMSDPLWTDFKDLAAAHGLRSCWSMPILSNQGSVLGTFATYSKEVREPTEAELRLVDVATRIAGIAIERKLAEEALRDSEQRFRAIFGAVNDAIIVHELNTGAFLDFNPRLCEMFGYTRDELMRLDLGGLSTGAPPYTMNDAHPLLKRALAGETPTFEWQCKTKDGRQFWIEVSVRRTSFGGRDVLISSARDITERKHAEERIARMARHDVVTGLPNRALLNERLSQALSHARRDDRWVTVLFVGLDNFKLFNNNLGHNVGDEILKAVAGRMLDCVRGTDTVARHGGDEFVVLLLDQPMSPAVIAQTAEDLRAAIAEPVRLDGQEFKVTCSIGIASHPCDGTDAKALLANAEAAMYRAKALGRDRFQFYVPELNTKAHEQFLLQAELRKAVARSQFVLLYQPQVDLRTGRVFAAEALIRWKHPTLGIISPLRFIGIAEDTGLIMPIGDWVLHEACRQNKAWQAAGLPPILVSVNVSARQFMDRSLLSRVVDALKESGLEARYLELELTESLIMQDVDLAVETMEQLRRLGVKLSIDDFGTGYSSLSALKTFPVGRLKIDRSFVDGLPANDNDKAVASAVIALGHKLKMRVIAEGIENEAQATFLRENDCDEMQGFLFCRPVRPQRIEELLGATPG